MSAADIYARDGSTSMASRIEGVVAEIAMDLAERFRERRQPQAREASLMVAQVYAQRAVDLAGSDETDASRLMAEITHVRLERLRGTPGDRTSRLKDLATLGGVRRDVAIEAQAYTELGRECEISGDRDSAMSWYRQAVAIVNEHKLIALATWAQRALYRLAGETQASDVGDANIKD
jgi:hypothetical protein